MSTPQLTSIRPYYTQLINEYVMIGSLSFPFFPCLTRRSRAIIPIRSGWLRVEIGIRKVPPTEELNDPNVMKKGVDKPKKTVIR